MNEQLIKLGIQAGLMTGEKEQLFFCRPITQFDEYSPEIEKFAKLIIEECLGIVNRKEYSYHEADPLWETAQLIKQHFGVTE